MASNVSSDNPLGLEPSELAASKRAKAAAAAKAAAQLATTSPAAVGLTDTQVERKLAQAATGSSGTTGSTGPATGPGTANGTGMGTINAAGGKGTTGAAATGPAQATPAATDTAAQIAADNKAISDKNALGLLTSTLQGYGIDSPNGAISNAILGLLQSNYDPSTIQALIENPSAGTSSDPNVRALASAWNTRFAGNVAREKAGLTPLSPSEYISTENSYKAVMARAGLDAAHMDPTKLAGLIGSDVSPSEVNQRINAAMDALTAEDPFVKQQLQQQFNLTTGDLVGHLLDPGTQSSVIANKVTAAQVGAEASRAGVDVNAANAYALANQGITQTQAQQGFQSIAQQLPATQELANRYAGYIPTGGVGAALQTATFGAPGTQTQAQAEAQLQRLKTQEVSAFSGSSGAGKGSLGISDESGLS